MFQHKDFRAVLVPKHDVELYHLDCSMIMEIRPLQDIPVSGFVAPVFPSDIWDIPFQSWLMDAPQRRDISLARFLDNSNKRFPAPRSYDGPQTATKSGFNCRALMRMARFEQKSQGSLMWIDDFLACLSGTRFAAVNIEKAFLIKNDRMPCRIYKYRAISDNSLNNLQTDTVWLSSASRYNDPFDSTLTFSVEQCLFACAMKNFEKMSTNAEF